MKPLIPITALVFLLTQLGKVRLDECPQIFLRYSSQHSYCKPMNRSCNILAYYPTADDISNIMNLHNSLRSKIATGTSFPILPTAGDMLEMEWDDELAAVAQKYAEQCLFQHDCPNCRRVGNFGVGQNIAIQKWTGGTSIPQPDWNFAVNEWFSEIVYFKSDNICPFKPPTGGNEIRHFTQLSWSKTFRVGCGYVLYKEGTETYVRLYICNYGPQGNVYDTCVYNTGPPCSKCPLNTCCGGTCTNGAGYFGLCKRLDSEAPRYQAPLNTIFYCDFRGSPDCDHYMEGLPKWLIESSLSGSYLSVLLNGGETSTIAFRKMMEPTAPFEQFCVTVEYRKGPNMDGDEASNTATETYIAPEAGMTVNQELATFGGSDTHMFAKFTMTMNWKLKTQLKLTFAVPPGKPAQFFHVQSVSATNGPCQN